MRPRARLWAGWFALALMAQDERPPKSGDLASLDLEGLLATPVTMVRRREESLSRAAGAVYVVTQEQIRRFGATSIPEALRLVPGLQVARVGVSNWAISTRGFNNVFANQLLVMIDGRTVYSPIFGGVYWDSQDTLLDDVDRIEVLRGPGAAMWGANAVTGVINIITKPAQRTQGTSVTVGTGSEDASILRLRHGGDAGKKGYYRFYTQQSYRSGPAIADGSLGVSNWDMLQGGFRGDWTLGERDNLTVQGDLFRSGARPATRIASLMPPYSTTTFDPTVTKGGNVLGRWEHSHRNGGLSSFQAYVDDFDRDSLTTIVGVFTTDLDYQYRHPAIGRHELSVSSGTRFVSDESSRSLVTNLTPASRNYTIQHVTLQDDINILPDRLIATVALREERNSFTGWTAQPTFRLLYAATKRHTFWGAWSRSVRTPSRGELDLDVLASVVPTDSVPLATTVLPAMRLKNEISNSSEFGYRGQLHRRLTLDTAMFGSKAMRLINVRPSGNLIPRLDATVPYFELPLIYGNGSHRHSMGWETSAQYTVHARLQLSGAYTWLWFSRIEAPTQLERDLAEFQSNYPGRQMYVRSEWRPKPRWELDTAYFFYGARHFDVPPLHRHRFDVRLGYRLTESTEISVGAQSITAGNRLEINNSNGLTNAPVRPSGYVRIRFRF